MTDNEKAERFALKVIRNNGGRISYFGVSVRMWKALKRLEKRGIVKWKVEAYPMWKITILKGKGKA